MIEINKPMVDWLTLTTHSATVARNIHAAIDRADVVGKWKPEKRMQYEGATRASAFIGEGIQNERPHFILQASGQAADMWLYRLMLGSGVGCTRIDIQVTIDLPPGWSSRKEYDDQIWHTAAHVHAQKLAIVQSGDGLDTIYFGSRTSERFARLYVKPSGDNSRLLRFEMEYKAARAQWAYSKALGSRACLGEFLRWELAQLAQTPAIEQLAAAAGKGLMEVPAGKRDGSNNTLKWLRTAVHPAIVRMLNDHDHHEETSALLDAWAAEFDEIRDRR